MSEQLELFAYDGPVSHTADPQTSKDAAASIVNASAKNHRRRLLLVFAASSRDLTCDEAQDAAGMETYQARRRISELLTMGLLERTGLTRAGRSGRQQTTIRLSEAGSDLVELMGA